MEVVQPNSHILLRMGSGQTRLTKVVPNTTIALGRFGSFPANSLIGRPYYLTWDVLDAPEVGLKLVSVKDIIQEQINAPIPPSVTRTETEDAAADIIEGEARSGLDLEDSAVGVEVTESGGEDLVLDDVGGKNNRDIRDDKSAQTLTAKEIEELKKRGDTDGGREIISKLLSSHVHIDKKTSFSLAKYTLRKAQKYLKRITVLPCDIPLYTNHLLSEKEPMKILEMRDEGIGLMMSWADVKWGGRWLVVDETGGLVVAAVAERMGLLHEEKQQRASSPNADRKRKREFSDAANPSKKREVVAGEEQEGGQEGGVKLANGAETTKPVTTEVKGAGEKQQQHQQRKHNRQRQSYEVPTSNTITLLHSLDQPNLSQLKPFSFDVSSPTAVGSHPLSRQLLPLTYLQLLSPEQDPFLNPPAEQITDEQLKSMKANKRTNYVKRYKRWEKQIKIVESTRQGGFDGVIIATGMELSGILNAVIPLVRGSGQVVIYSPNEEPLAEVADWYSTLRRSEFQRRRQVAMNSASTDTSNPTDEQNNDKPEASDGNNNVEEEQEEGKKVTIGYVTIPPLKAHQHSNDFPVDPTLLLAPTLHTSRMRRFQALPGRTHPLMTSRGGSEGYILHATRVLPVVHGAVTAMGTRIRPKRRAGAAAAAKEAKEKEQLEGDGEEGNKGKEDVEAMVIDDAA